MTTGEQLFSDFRAEFESGARPNVADFLAEANDADRRALEARIDLYLEDEAPLRSFDAAEFAAAQETPVMKQAAALFEQAAQTNLVAARERAGMTLDELAAAADPAGP